MNKKLVSIAILMVTTLTLVGCNNSESNVSNVKTSQNSNTQQSEKNTQAKKLNFNSNEELNQFAKEKTSKFYQVIQKNKIDGIVTPDNMYAVNTKQQIEKYNRTYNFCTEYKVIPNFETGNGAGIMTLYSEKNIDDAFSKTDNKIQFINDAINELTSIGNISIDDFVEKLNKADNNAKNDPSNKCVVPIDKNNTVSMTIYYNQEKSKNLTQLLIKYAQPFKNYTFGTNRKKYDTVKEFENEDSRKKQVVDFGKKYGDAQDLDSSNTKVNFDGGSININYGFSTSSDIGFSDYYNIEGTINEYDINNPSKGNEKIKIIYDFMKTMTLNDKLSEDEFNNYIESIMIFNTYKYTGQKFRMDSAGEPKSAFYYMPFNNIEKKQYEDGSSESQFFVGLMNDANNPENNSKTVAPLQLRIKYTVPVVAEGITRN